MHYATCGGGPRGELRDDMAHVAGLELLREARHRLDALVAVLAAAGRRLPCGPGAEGLHQMQGPQQPLLSGDDSAEAGYASPDSLRRGSDASLYSPLPFGSPPHAQGTSPGVFAFGPRAPLPAGALPTGLPRRRWRGSLLACCGA